MQKRPALTIPEFLAGEETFYKVTLPASPNFDLPQRYPWLLHGSPKASAASWEVSFNRAGVPLKVEPAALAVTSPALSYVKKAVAAIRNKHAIWSGGSGELRGLSESGERLMRLLIWPD